MSTLSRERERERDRERERENEREIVCTTNVCLDYLPKSSFSPEPALQKREICSGTNTYLC